MSKSIAEQSNRLSIFWLNKHGYLPAGGGWRYGGIKWTYGMSGDESSIGFTVTTNGDDGDSIRLQYTHTSQWTGEKESMDYRVELATTPCNYGGKRYWFICPLSKNGQYCGRRVGVLFSIGKWFGCRHCGEIAYQAQFEGGKFRVGSVCEPDVDRAWDEIKRQYYNGKPTRRYKHYLRLREKIDNSWIKAAMAVGIKF